MCQIISLYLLANKFTKILLIYQKSEGSSILSGYRNGLIFGNPESLCIGQEGVEKVRRDCFYKIWAIIKFHSVVVSF